MSETSSDVKVVAPPLPEALDEGQKFCAQRQLLDRLCQEHHIVQPDPLVLHADDAGVLATISKRRLRRL